MSPAQSVPRILPATEADLPQIAQLAGLIWRTYYPGIISNEQIEYMLGKMYALETLREEILRRAIRYEQLFMGRELAGFASHGPTEQVNLFKLHKIYLHPSWHSRGLGRVLLLHCEREVCEMGAERLLLTVNKRNARAIATYQRNGFTITDSVVVNIGGGFVMDDYVMMKILKS